MKTRRIIYDATILAGGFRSGIFFAAFNILLGLLRRDELEVWLYFSPETTEENVAKLRAELAGRGFRHVRRYNGTVPAWGSCAEKIVERISPAIESLWASGFLKVFALPLRLVRKICHLVHLHSMPDRAIPGDVFFSPLYAVPPEFKAAPVERSVVLYDMIPTLFPQFYPPLDGSWYRTMLDSLNPRDRYFAISETTKRDFLNHCPQLTSQQIRVIPLAADGETFHRETDPSRIAAVLGKHGLNAEQPYFLSICSIDPRKNLIHVVKSFLEFVREKKISDLQLVLVGGSYDKLHQPVREELERLAAESGRIVLTGYVPDGDLASLYSHALCFLYVSLYEGFGMPPLEAMQCETPVITSNNSSLPEVVGDAALMVDAKNKEELIAAMQKFHGSAATREEYRKRGLARAKEFSWDRTADAIVNSL